MSHDLLIHAVADQTERACIFLANPSTIETKKKKKKKKKGKKKKKLLTNS